jgi:large subunit ribosomal protein L15
MKLHTLKPATGSTKNNTRLGRGTGSGKGRTSTRGHKGDGSRSGSRRKAGFEGGQMPLYRRIPKFGFTPLDKVIYQPINLDTLDKLSTEKSLASIGIDELVNAGLSSKKDKVKVLGRGEIKVAVNVSAHAFSKSAVAKIEAAGGSVTTL